MLNHNRYSLGTPETNLRGLSTLMALRVLRSTLSSSFSSSSLSDGSSGVRIVMYLQRDHYVGTNVDKILVVSTGRAFLALFLEPGWGLVKNVRTPPFFSFLTFSFGLSWPGGLVKKVSGILLITLTHGT